ncbi:hypothetical protein [Streptomyces sp. NPDC056323]|uniref:hypothetical protein n=1 Tax=unclassified Streptomyces TaxID=2593676 RepID=UPI0035D59EF8
MPHPAQGQAHANAYALTQFPTQAHTYPVTPTPQTAPQAPQRPEGSEGSGKRRAVTAIAAALVLGVVAGGALYFLLKKDDQKSQASSSSGGSQTSGTTGGQKPSGDKETDSKPSTKPRPEPAEYKGIDLPADYHLTLGDDDVRPQKGEDGGYELSYDTGRYRDSETTGGTLVLLDPGQVGSLDVCRAETRFTETIDLSTLSKGRQICVTTGTGHMGLVTVQGLPSEDSPSEYMTLDLTVWRNAAGTATGN